ncbi:hypothetical protein ACFSSA_02245 [Luteolibacter algae]|uniref:Serine protease n=1 Tax=Luteolibacter algae TaxID=454151 RepID=A0ABW5D451_9BACT
MMRKALVLLLFGSTFSQGLEIRNYSASRHDRFVTEGQELALNHAAYYNSSLYTGVGFATNPGDNRQFALVTPEHVIFARHFSGGGNLRFISSRGTAIDRSLATNITVPNDTGGTSDVIIIRLNEPIDEAEGVAPMAYLNLATEAAYNNTVLTVFGQTQRAGRGRISSFYNFVGSGIEQTRAFRFFYTNLAGDQDDSYLVTGDSGSPSFAIANNQPALVGVHLAAGTTVGSRVSVDSFIPHYAATINDLLAPEGYQLIPAYPTPVTLAIASSHSTLRQTEPGGLEISLGNTSSSVATNPRLTLIFPANAIPDTLSAPGWIIENPSVGTYHMRRAELPGSSSSTATVGFDEIPVLPEFSVSVIHRSDGSPELNETLTMPISETFAGFVSELAEKGELDDPDSDGFPNLMEFALGGDPAVSSQLTAAGIPLAPQSSETSGEISYTFPQRIDPAAYNLSYVLQFSETLEAGSFSSTPPSGYAISTAPYDPAIPGFEKVTATFPGGSPEKLFVRLKIESLHPAP